MRRQRLSKKRFAFLIGLFLLALFPNSGPPAVAAPRVSGEITAHEVTIALPAFTGTLTRQGGGTINAADAGQTGGDTLLFSSPTISAGQLFDRVGVHWVAARGTEDSFYVELRTSADGANWSDWDLLSADEDMANLDTNEWYASPRLAVDSARYAQYRVWLTDGDPSDVQRVGITFMDVNDLNAGPVARFVGDIVGAAKDVARSFTEPAAANAAINPTRILGRSDWAADEKLMQWIPRYPKKVAKAVVHHTVTDDGGNGQVAASIRAIYYYHAVTRGWGDIGYSYIVDKYGNVWTGRQGGDNTEAGHAYGWNQGSIGIAALGTYSVTQPTPAMIASIANVIAMKFTQFGIQPYGADPFVHQEQAPNGTWVNVTSSPPNVQGHRDCNYIQSQYGGQTACPGNALYAQLTNIRQMAQTAVNNGYNQMPFLETTLPKAGYPGANLTVGVTVANKGKTNIPAGTRVSYRVIQGANTVVPQGATGTIGADIVPGAIGAVNVPFTVPAIGNYIVRWDLQTAQGAWWNTSFGSPVREQYFRGADWSADWVSDDVPISWTAGETRMINVTVANDGGRVWNAAGTDPVQLGYKWVSNATGNTFPGATKVALPNDVQPGQTVSLQIPVTAPVYPTNYTMSLDLYKQNEFAFADKGIGDDDTNTGVSVDFKAGYTFNAVPKFTAGQTTTVPVTIRNMGNGTFPTTNGYPVNLAYHWTSSAGANVIWDGARTPLGGDLLSGQALTVNATVTAPTAGGSYVLKLDLVQEGVSWFSAKGVSTGNTSIAIDGPAIPSFGANYAIPPISGTASGTTTAQITLGNTSNFTWPAAGANPVTLSYHWLTTAGKTVVWDGLRTKLPADVPAGQLTQVQANLAFPSTPGTYVLRWDLVQEGVTWFSGKGVRMPEQTVSVSAYVAPFFGASLGVDQTPDTMTAKTTASVPVKIENMSNFDWTSNVNLSYHWYDAAGNLVAWDGLRTPLAGTARTQIAAVNAQIAVPATPGTYKLRYDIVQEGIAWFSSQGMQTPVKTVSVVVPALSATYSAPATVNGAVNTMVTVPITITNAGTTTWQPGAFNAAYHLYAPSGAVYVWDGVRTSLPTAVAQGQAVALNLIVKMPAGPGTYTLRFDVVQEGVAWFSGQGVPMGSATLQVQ